MLERIEVKGYKSIREMALDLRSLNVLIGANGSGKSNFLSVFHLLKQLAEQNLQLYVAKAGGADTLLHYGRRVTDELALRVDFGDYRYDVTLAPTADDTLVIAKEEARGSLEEMPTAVSLEGERSETSFLGTLLATMSPVHTRATKQVTDHLQRWRVYHFHDTSESAKVRLTGDLNDNAFLRTDGSNLAAFLYLLRERYTSYYDRIVRTIRLAAPFFDDFNLRPNPLNPDTILLRWKEKGYDGEFGAHMLSDGTLRFMCLATLLLQPEVPSTILIDEPELGLHPYASTLLASMLQSVSATQTQVIVSTQSVPLVNQFAPEDIIVVDREGGQSTFRRLSLHELESWIGEYGLGDLWEKNVLGGRP